MRRPHRSHTLLGSLLTPLLSAALPTFAAGQDASVSAESSSSSRDLFQIAAVRVERSPTVDGLLDEELWEQAFLVDAFVQQEPNEGAPASERTEVRVMYDGSTLYLGFTARTETRAPLAHRPPPTDRSRSPYQPAAPTDYQCGLSNCSIYRGSRGPTKELLEQRQPGASLQRRRHRHRVPPARGPLHLL